ncbi:hypothetical protein Tco_0776816 [Tanacetum coccineum]
MERGLRQGDPLSPLLFLLVAKALQVLILEACSKGFFKGISLAEDGTNISLLILLDANLGGLGVGSIFAKNISLLEKWKWRFLIEKSALWQVVIKRYFSDNGGFGSPLSWAVKKGVWYDIVKVVLDIDDAIFLLLMTSCRPSSFTSFTQLGKRSTTQSCKFTSDDAWTWTWDCSRKFKVKSLAVTVQNSILSDCELGNHHLWNSLVPQKDLEHSLIKCPKVLPIWRRLWSWWGLARPTFFLPFSIKDIALRNISSNNCSKLNKEKLHKADNLHLLSPNCPEFLLNLAVLVGPKSPPELRKSWCVKGHIKFGVISSVLMQQYQRKIRQSLRAEKKAKLKESRTPLVGFSSEVSYPIGIINLNMTIGEPGRLQTIPMEFEVVKSHSPYNVILGRTSLRSLGGVASTIHSMIKFPTTNGIATMTTKKETLQECQRMEEAQGPVMEGRTIPPKMKASESEGTTSKGKEGSRGQTDKTVGPDDIIQPSPISSNKYTQAGKKDKGEDEGGDS